MYFVKCQFYTTINFFKKIGHSRLFFVFSVQLTVNKFADNYKAKVDLGLSSI